MHFRQRLERLDIFKTISDEFKESSYLGILFSLAFLLTAAVLILNQLVLCLSHPVTAQLLIDHMKDDKDLTVNIDITLHSYPCSILSLDKEDEVFTHSVDIQESLIKMRLKPTGEPIEHQATETLTVEQRVFQAKEQIEAREGCHVSGKFTIKQVPGNFHFSFHNYQAEVQELMRLHRYQPDFSHTIKYLYFGDASEEMVDQLRRDFNLVTLHSLSGAEESNLAESLGFPHGVIHHINIVPSTFTYENESKSFDVYQYTASTFKWVGSVMSVMFKINVENVMMDSRRSAGSFAHFLLQTAAILGSLYMLADVAKSLIEDTLLGLIYKRRLGKLE